MCKRRTVLCEGPYFTSGVSAAHTVSDEASYQGVSVKQIPVRHRHGAHRVITEQRLDNFKMARALLLTVSCYKHK